MKTTKRILACLMIVVMLAAMLCGSASAVEITIDTTSNVAYEAYKIFDIELNSTTKAYNYTIDSGSAWYEFVTTGAGKDYVTLTRKYSTTTYYVTEKIDNAIEFANDAFAYATTKSIVATKSVDKKITLSDGYYVMKSPVGTLPFAFSVIDNKIAFSDSSIYGTNTIKEKVKLPSIVKSVDNAVAATTDTLNYNIVVTAKDGAMNYTVRDNADDGITVNTASIVVKMFDESEDTTTTLTEGSGKDYTLSTGIPGCDFEIKFSDALCNALDTKDTLTITYTGQLNADADMGGTGNANTATLYHGADGNSDTLPDLTEVDSAYVHTYEIIINKTYAGGGTPDGAVFTLYKHNGSDYAEVGTFTETTANTVFSYKGLAEGKYKISETAVPAGYVKADDVEFVVTATADSTAPAEFTDLSAAGFSADKADGSLSIDLENKTGSLLPETGGMGTTLFYAVGGMLVLGAVVVLLMKKRTVTE